MRCESAPSSCRARIIVRAGCVQAPSGCPDSSRDGPNADTLAGHSFLGVRSAVHRDGVLLPNGYDMGPGASLGHAWNPDHRCVLGRHLLGRRGCRCAPAGALGRPVGDVRCRARSACDLYPHPVTARPMPALRHEGRGMAGGVHLVLRRHVVAGRCRCVRPRATAPRSTDARARISTARTDRDVTAERGSGRGADVQRARIERPRGASSVTRCCRFRPATSGLPVPGARPALTDRSNRYQGETERDRRADRTTSRPRPGNAGGRRTCGRA
jgi:hypothetical protein